jgi:hypothetical protein
MLLARTTLQMVFCDLPTRRVLTATKCACSDFDIQLWILVNWCESTTIKLPAWTVIGCGMKAINSCVEGFGVQIRGQELRGSGVHDTMSSAVLEFWTCGVLESGAQGLKGLSAQGVKAQGSGVATLTPRETSRCLSPPDSAT